MFGNDKAMGSYLGILESLGGSKTKKFNYISERLHDRVSGWSVKFLSKGGKKILINSVALPTYIMSCFKLPHSLTSKLTSVILNFWWNTNESNYGLHWIL